jgi:hypothetical protein
MVPYDKTNDYYFSGHTATMVIIMMGIFFYIGLPRKIRIKYELETDLEWNRNNLVEEVDNILEEENELDEAKPLLKTNKMYYQLDNNVDGQNDSIKKFKMMIRIIPMKWWAKLYRIVFVFGLLQTIFLLIVTSFHYSNDVLIGFIVGMFVFLICDKYKYSVNYFFLRIYCFISCKK